MRIECFSRRFCQACSKSFNSRFCFLLHRHVHKQDLKPVACKRCNKRFLKIIQFEKHKYLHKKKINEDSRIKLGLRLRASFKPLPLGLLRRRIPTATRFYVSSPSSTDSEADENDRKVEVMPSSMIGNFTNKEEDITYHCLSVEPSVNSRPSANTRLQTFASLEHNRELSTNEFSYEDDGKRPIIVPVAVYESQPAFQSSDTPNEMTIEEGRYVCYICNKHFDKPRSLAAHARSHSDNNPYTCLLCGRSFKQPSSLVMHTKSMHMKSEYLQCRKCNKSFKKESSLENHMLMMHEFEDEQSTSNTESIPEPVVISNQSPLSIIEEVDPSTLDGSLEYGEFTCDICFRTFEQKAQIQIHMRVHAPGGEHKFACHMCSKTFKTSSDLKRHLRVHTGERPYVCMFCNKGFGNSGNLKQHIRTHTGHCPYECKKCNKRFKRPNAVKHHICISEPQSGSQPPNGIEIMSNRILPSQQALNAEFDDQELLYAQPSTCQTMPIHEFRERYGQLQYPAYGQLPKQASPNNRSPKQSSLSQIVTNLKANAMGKVEPSYQPVFIRAQNNIHASVHPFYNQVVPNHFPASHHLPGRETRSGSRQRHEEYARYPQSANKPPSQSANKPSLNKQPDNKRSFGQALSSEGDLSNSYPYNVETEFFNDDYPHMIDTGFQCDVCHKMCKNLTDAVEHMSIHTGELPVGCKKCCKVFCKASSLAEHICTSTLTCPLKNFPLRD